MQSYQEFFNTSQKVSINIQKDQTIQMITIIIIIIVVKN